MPSAMVKTWNQAAADVVWHRTGVSVTCRARAQHGGIKHMYASGPLAKLEEAIELAQKYLKGDEELKPLEGSEAQRVREAHAAEREARRQQKTQVEMQKKTQVMKYI